MKKTTRREFLLRTAPTFLAAASLAGVVQTLGGCSHESASLPRSTGTETHPNILVIMVDQMHTPPEGYRSDEGAAQGLKEILGFRPLSADNPFTRFFPGLLRLRRNGVVLRKHYTASSACVPSRTCIMTGQYPTLTGVTQTDGNYKSTDDVPFLDPAGTPTIGDWFRAVGYSTHYFGKWHVSEPTKETDYLEPWGFSDWELSYPEPHGGSSNNLGAYRDVEFTNTLCDFLQRKGTEAAGSPWLAVGSLVNPHDISAWPVNWQVPYAQGVVPWSDYPPPPSIPAQGARSLPGGINQAPFRVELNPDGFPQDTGTLPRTYGESLDTKPRCQRDYSFKWGLSAESNADYVFNQKQWPYTSPHPFQLQGADARPWSLSYNQFYLYLHYLVDLQIRRILQALDDSKLTDSTIVVFLSDHGDMQSAHGSMIQKWHNAYEETVRVPMVFSSPLLNKGELREVQQPTSSIDLAPTLLTLAGFDVEWIRQMRVLHNGSNRALVKPFPGADLASHIKGSDSGQIIGPDGLARSGVFFMTNDMITELGTVDPGDDKKNSYDAFLANVRARADAGVPVVYGTVRQPNNVRALFTGDWKIVRYVDPGGAEADEWELYCLTSDPVEETNLVDYRNGLVRNDVTVPGMTTAELVAKCEQLKSDLARAEAALPRA